MNEIALPCSASSCSYSVVKLLISQESLLKNETHSVVVGNVILQGSRKFGFGCNERVTCDDFHDIFDG